MNDKAVLENPTKKDRFKWFKGLQYWIAVISYLIIFSLSILCLAYYLPHLYKADVLDTGTLNVLTAMLIIVLVVGTVALAWEMLQWRKSRMKKDQQPNLEDIIKGLKKDSNSSP